MNTKKEYPVCDRCGSPNVSADAAARWDHEEQDWTVTNVFDKGHSCDDCGDECKIEWEEGDYPEALAAALSQQPAACPKCGGTGEADSGGIMPWGAPAMIPCECQQPAAVGEECAHCVDGIVPMTFDRLCAHCCGTGIAAQPGGSDNGR